MKGQLRGAGDVVVFVYPGLVVRVMRGKLNSGVVVNVVVCIPVA